MNAIQLTEEIFPTYEDAIKKYGTDRLEIPHFKPLSLVVEKPCCNLKDDMVVQQLLPPVNPISFIVEFRLRRFYGNDGNTYWRYVSDTPS